MLMALRILPPMDGQKSLSFAAFSISPTVFHHMTPLSASLRDLIRAPFNAVFLSGSPTSAASFPQKLSRLMAKPPVVRAMLQLIWHHCIWLALGQQPTHWYWGNCAHKINPMKLLLSLYSWTSWISRAVS